MSDVSKKAILHIGLVL